MEDLARIGTTPNSYMPELPEVETVKNVLSPIVINHKIVKIDVLRKSIIKNESVDEFVKGLENETFLHLERIGKFLIFHLSHDKVMISHLRMEGKYFEFNEKENNSKYARVVFHLDNNKKVCYDDSRTFGMMKLTTEQNYLNEKDIAQLGKEPFVADPKEIYQRCKKNNGPIKSTLLDQTLMTGLGNIYADEVCFACHLYPLTPTKLISLKKWEEIVRESARVLNEAIALGGSTIRSYHPGKGIDGNFQTVIKAYGKKDEACPNCGHTFRFMKVGGRGTTYCPNCQYKGIAPIKVAIFGKSGSGKSTVLNAFKENGYPTISSDEVVHDLYQSKEVIDKINKAFGFNFKNEVGREELRKYLSSHPKEVKTINKIVHPLVKKEIEKFMASNNKEIIVAEVPLLFEAKMENMFDILIAVDIDKKEQEKRLLGRDKESAKQIEKINAYSAFDKNKEKADFVVNNNFDLNKLNKQVKEIINKLQYRLNHFPQ